MTTEDPRDTPQDSVPLAESSSEASVAEPSAEAEQETSEQPKKPRRKMSLLTESVLLLVIALAVAIGLKTFFVQAFYIPSESMEPGLVEGDRILVQKVSYWGSGSPERGDVVVFEDPGNWLPGGTEEPRNIINKALIKIGLQPSGGHLVKRVIGVAGDTIECCDDKGRLSINGHPMDESYILEQPSKPYRVNCNGPMNPNSCNWRVGPIPEGKLFVMGDNRHHSADSTVHLCPNGATNCVDGDEYVSTDMVVGKVFVLAWPASRFEWVKRPAEFEAVPDPVTPAS